VTRVRQTGVNGTRADNGAASLCGLPGATLTPRHIAIERAGDAARLDAYLDAMKRSGALRIHLHDIESVGPPRFKKVLMVTVWLSLI
jgi:hypothetical protein